MAPKFVCYLVLIKSLFVSTYHECTAFMIVLFFFCEKISKNVYKNVFVLKKKKYPCRIFPTVKFLYNFENYE